MNTLARLQSTRTAAVDAIREEHAAALTQVLSVVGFALLTAAAAQARIYIWEVPFSLQTLAVFGSGLFLGWRNGMLSQVLYLSIGLVFPVYAGDTFGPAYLFGAPTAGYLLAFPLTAAAIGYLSRNWNSFSGSLLSMLVGSVIYFSIGTLWLHFTLDLAWMESLMRGWIAFLPIELVKLLIAGIGYSALRKLW